jgi:hypothetical protein
MTQLLIQVVRAAPGAILDDRSPARGGGDQLPADAEGAQHN